MPFPAFDYCILCEGIRPEVGGKVTILGFYGLAPNIEVAVGNPNQPLVLSFIAGFPPVTETTEIYENTISLFRPNGTTVLQTPSQRLDVSAPGRGNICTRFAIQPPFVWGEHIIQIHVNHEEKLAARFRLRQASAAELVGLPEVPFPPPVGRPN